MLWFGFTSDDSVDKFEKAFFFQVLTPVFSVLMYFKPDQFSSPKHVVYVEKFSFRTVYGIFSVKLVILPYFGFVGIS